MLQKGEPGRRVLGCLVDTVGPPPYIGHRFLKAQGDVTTWDTSPYEFEDQRVISRGALI